MDNFIGKSFKEFKEVLSSLILAVHSILPCEHSFAQLN